MKKVLLGVLLTVSAGCLGGPVDLSQIPATATWLVHIDFDQVRQSKTGVLLMDEVIRQHQKKVEKMKSIVGLDLQKDLRAATFFGPNGEEQELVMLFDIDYDPEAFKAYRKEHSEFSEEPYGGHILYHATGQKDREIVGAFPNDHLMIFSCSEVSLCAVLDLMESDGGASLASAKSKGLYKLCQDGQDAMVFAAADKLNKLAQKNAKAAILKESQMALAVAAEKSGMLALKINLTAKNAESATEIEQIVLGMRALMSLSQKENPAFARLLAAATLERQDNELTFSFEYPSADLLKIFKDQGCSIEWPQQD